MKAFMLKKELIGASLVTLGLLFTMLFAALGTLLYMFGMMSAPLLIGLTIFISLASLFIGPTIQDFMYSWFYKLRWISMNDLKGMSKKTAAFLEATCSKNNIKVPKIGYIEDDNPQAFTYGTAAYNARLVFTKGIPTYLNENEINAVFAHELGHIVHNDFIVMSMATLIVSLIYEISQIFYNISRSKSGSGKKNGKGGAFLAYIITYLFYVISTYIVLYLSRVREYYADEFSAENTGNADYLSMALIKIAYGIVAKKDNPGQMRLMESTRQLGLMDFKLAKGTGLMYSQAGQRPEAIKMAILYDLKNPWAFINEISSTHPLIGKRILKLSGIMAAAGKKSMFNASEIEAIPIDKERMYGGFYKDVTVLYLGNILAIPAIAAVLLYDAPLLAMGGLVLIAFGVSGLAQARWKFNTHDFSDANVQGLMADIYASPVKGTPVRMQGSIVGRGTPGYIGSEDMMLQDKSGLIFANYESIWGFLGNIFFALTKFQQLMNKKADIKGWFLRGVAPYIELSEVNVEGQKMSSSQELWQYAGGTIVAVIGFALLGIGTMVAI